MGRVGRVEMAGNPCQKVDPQKLLPSTINLPGVFAIILGTFGEGLGVWGEGPVLDPLLAGKLLKTEALGGMHGLQS